MINIDLPSVDCYQSTYPSKHFEMLEKDQNTKSTYFVSSTSSNIIIIDLELKNTMTNKVENYNRDTVRLLSEAGWAQDFFAKSYLLNDIETIYPYYEKIDDLLSDGQYMLCDIFLSKIKAENLSNTLLFGMLRLTANFNKQLPSWEFFLNDVKKEMIARKMDVGYYLRGLV